MAPLASDCQYPAQFDSLSQSDIELFRSFASYIITFIQAMLIGGLAVDIFIVQVFSQKAFEYMAAYRIMNHQKGDTVYEDVEAAIGRWDDVIRIQKQIRAELIALRMELGDTFCEVDESRLESGAVGQLNGSKEEMENTKEEKR
ncbi:hypothetical protein G7Y79_00002g007520 [Physcia stellaris]|nr:hypothetical protein G7Y79_00002g007520 [Physcia stellaris]